MEAFKDSSLFLESGNFIGVCLSVLFHSSSSALDCCALKTPGFISVLFFTLERGVNTGSILGLQGRETVRPCHQMAWDASAAGELVDPLQTTHFSSGKGSENSSCHIGFWEMK